jgi:excisionase family DNA binding protein
MTREKKAVAKPIGDRLLTLREAAEVLRLNPRTVREYVQRGEIGGRIIGGRWRFRRADLDAFFENASREWDFARKSDRGSEISTGCFASYGGPNTGVRGPRKARITRGFASDLILILRRSRPVAGSAPDVARHVRYQRIG